jgi:class 3 adenylate cyclase
MNGKEFEKTLMANETIDATVAFVDICGFTAITEKEPADNVINVLNRYFDLMVKEIIAHGGQIDKFIGDAVMAVFRGEFHLDRAIEASLAVRAQIEKLPVDENAGYMPKVSIGLNSGEMISGNIGSATLKRLDYTVIGDVVNTAQRLQTAAAPGQILLEDNCYQKVKDFFKFHKVGEIVVKNKEKPLVAYEVLN